MDLRSVVDLFLHLDKHLVQLVQACGGWTYLVLFLIIFCETGLVVMPLLPGDSLLFAAGAMSATGVLDPVVLGVMLFVAAVIGDTVNYKIGAYIGPRAFDGSLKWLKQEHLQRTHAFFEKYGGKTIILARFVPIVRTFAPFVAGVGAMTYGRFFLFNVVGAFLWITIFVAGGYWFGNLPAVKHNFTLVILGIIGVSVLPAVYEYLSHRRKST